MEVPLSQAYGLPAPLSGEPNETSPERGGEPSQTVEGFLWNLLLNVKGLWKHPSVKPTACQLPFQGSRMKPPLKGEGNRRQTVEGFFVESFA